MTRKLVAERSADPKEHYDLPALLTVEGQNLKKLARRPIKLKVESIWYIVTWNLICVPIVQDPKAPLFRVRRFFSFNPI